MSTFLATVATVLDLSLPGPLCLQYNLLTVEIELAI
jgi:hypothetical protein